VGIVVRLLMTRLAGGSVVIDERFNPHTFFGLVAQERPTCFSGVPTI
jgi:hypothetical protein